MKSHIAPVLALAVVAACHRGQGAIDPLSSWAAARLAPRLEFNEPIAGGDVVLLVIDAHSGEPIAEVTAFFPENPKAVYSDSLGRIRFHDVAPGAHDIRIRRIGYVGQTRSVTLSNGTGLALVVQLSRMPSVLGPIGLPAQARPE